MNIYVIGRHDGDFEGHKVIGLKTMNAREGIKTVGG